MKSMFITTLIILINHSISISQDLYKLYDVALKHYEDEKFEKCIKYLDKAIKIDSSFTKAYKLKNRVFKYQFGTEDSILKYKSLIVKYDKKDQEEWVDLFNIYLKKQNLVKQETCLMALTGIVKTFTDCNYLGVVKTSLGKFKEALVAFKEAELIDSSAFNIKYNIGYSYIKLDSLDMAEFYFNKLNQQKPGMYKLGTAIVSFKKGDYSKTILLLNSIERKEYIGSCICEIYFYRGLAFCKQDDQVSSLIDYSQLKKLKCDNHILEFDKSCKQ